MPNVNFWVKDKLYSKYVNLPFERKQKLKKSWRKAILKAIAGEEQNAKTMQ